jgi:hypothetical protein
MRLFFYAPHGHELASAFVLAARAAGLSCRLRNDTAFAGPADCEKADAVVVLPDRPRTGMIAIAYADRNISVVTASHSETAEALLARVTQHQEMNDDNLRSAGWQSRAGSGEGSTEPIPPGHQQSGQPSADQSGQGSEPNAGQGQELAALTNENIPVTSAPSVEETPNARHTRRYPQRRKQ